MGIGHTVGPTAIRWPHNLTYHQESKSDVDRICQNQPTISASVCSASTVEPATTGIDAPLIICPGDPAAMGWYNAGSFCYHLHLESQIRLLSRILDGLRNQTLPLD